MLSLVFIAVAAILLLAVFFAAYVVYDSYCLSRDGKERSFILFIVGMLLSSYLAAALIGAMALIFFVQRTRAQAVHLVLQLCRSPFLAASVLRHFSSFGHVLVAASGKASNVPYFPNPAFERDTPKAARPSI